VRTAQQRVAWGWWAQMTGLDEPEPQVDTNLKQLFEALGNRGAGETLGKRKAGGRGTTETVLT